MSGIHTGTMLAYLAGAAMFVCAVMAVYWSAQRVPPGFGLWTVSSALIGVACAILTNTAHYPRPVFVLMAPGLILVAAVLRLEGLRQFLGKRGTDLRLVVLPLAGVGVIGVFTYAWGHTVARTMVTTAVVASILFWMAVIALRSTKRPGSFLTRTTAGLFAVYGVFWLASGIHWVVKGTGFPFGDIDTPSIMFLAVATAFEFFWLIAALLFSARWNSEAVKAARDLADEERRQLAGIVAFLPDATFALDMDQKVIAWNHVMEETTGVPAAQMLGVHWGKEAEHELVGGDAALSAALLHPDSAIPSRYRNARRDGDSISAEQEWRHPSDPERHGHFWHTATLLRDAEGRIIGTIESIRDVTSIIEAEGAIRESEERYRSLFDHSLDGILVIAPGGSVVEANPAACRMLGMSRDEVSQTDPGSLVSLKGEPEDGRPDHTFSSTGVRELDFARGDGSTFPAECMSVVWSDSTGRLRAFVQFRDISERIEAQRILRESQASLVKAQSVPQMGSWEIDLVGRSIRLSPATMQIFGITRHSPYFALEEGTLGNLAQEPGTLEAEIARVVTEGGSYDVEYTIKRDTDGAPRKVRSVGSAVCDAAGTPVRVVGVTQDIAESPVAREPYDLSLHALEHSEDQVFWVDGEGKITNVSKSACAQLGYTREELTAMSIYEVNPLLAVGSAETIEQVKREGVRRHETVHRTKDGREIPVEVTVSYALHEGREYKFVVAHDISDRRELEETLKRTQISLERGGGVVLWADEKGLLTFATDEACERLGLRREQMLSRTVRDVGLVGSQDWTGIWTEVMDHGSSVHQATLQAEGGIEKPVDVTLYRVDYEGQDYALVTLHDSSEERTDAPAAEGVDLAALQSQKLEAVGQLAGGIAHDFNNLLTAIIGYGDLILADEDTHGLGTLRRDAGEIRNAAQRAAALTSQILAFARRQPLSPRTVDIGDLVGEMEEHLRRRLRDDVLLTVSKVSKNCVAEVDVEQFEQILVNLFLNAQEAMPAGGRLHIEVQNVALNEESCRAYPELEAGSYVLLSVSDTGVGMDPVTQQRIFEPFFTTKAPGEGTGLGLSVVYGFAKQSGGNVVAFSEIEKGTTMKVYLPMVSEVAESVEKAPLPAPSPGAGGETVLVVDDEAPLRRLVARVLGEHGYRVFVAGSGPEALELLEDMQDIPDLLVTDVVLPGAFQGNELAEKLTAKIPGLRVLYVSGHPRDTIVHSGRLDEGVFFLGKPFTPEKLSSAVLGVLNSARPEN